MEKQHDYFQALFPTTKRSDSNTLAPVISQQECNAIQQSKTAMDNYKRGLKKMCQFFGITYDVNTGIMTHQPGFKKIGQSHNTLRLTRMLQSLILFGLQKEAESLLENLNSIYSDSAFEESRKYWYDSVHPEQAQQAKKLKMQQMRQALEQKLNAENSEKK